jgi:hypothetical protein
MSINPETLAATLGSGRAKVGIALVVVLLLVGAAVTASVFPTASNQGYAPEQPIPFSHKLHAGDNKIACQYCHTNVERSRHASVPGVGLCMNCHSFVKVTSPWIQKVQAAYKEKKPIEWVRVHELPDYVYFPHKRHVAKGVACESCHGNVKEMDKVAQHAALTMGWCMECHRGQTTPKNVLARVHRDKERNPSFIENQVAPTNCTTCHN